MTALFALLLASCELPAAQALEPATRVEAACALMQQSATEVKVDRAALDEVLSTPEFAHARDRKEAALEVLLERFRLWLLSLFESGGAVEYAKLARAIVLGVAFVVALVGLLTLGRRLRRRSESAPVASSSSGLDLQDPALHLARARATLAVAPREAIREGLLALLSSLERQRLARPDRVKTNRELADELPLRGADPALVSQVRALLDWYDATFYSLHPVEVAAAGRFVDQVDALASAGSR